MTSGTQTLQERLQRARELGVRMDRAGDGVVRNLRRAAAGIEGQRNGRPADRRADNNGR